MPELNLARQNGNRIKAIAAASQMLTCIGIGYVENMGAAIKSPVNLVKIAINKIILAAENNTSRLNIMPRRLTEVSYP